MNLVRIASFIGLLKRPILINIFFNSQFSYCLLICETGDAFVLFTMINSPGFQSY